MRFEEYSSVVAPNLSCAFKVGDNVLLVASAPDESSARAAAVIRIESRLIPLVRAHAGGFHGMLTGSNTFEGNGYSVTVERAHGAGRREGVETTLWAAALLLENADRRQTISGGWSCGA